MAHVGALVPERQSAAIWTVKIDYASVTTGELHVPLPISGKDARTYSVHGAAAVRSAALHALASDDLSLWQDKGGRSGYAISSAHEIGARVFFGHEKAPPLIELPGAACDMTHQAGELLPFLARNTEGVTRIDLAADLEHDITPFDFVAAGRSARQRSLSRVDSDKGQTVYIGSPKSDRRLRVYRYAPPHPRARFIRVECMLRDELARLSLIHI